MDYWLIKTLLVLGIIAVIFFVLRPVKTQNSLALRRIGMLLILIAAASAVIFPEMFNWAATLIGVDTGINLLVYLLVIALFIQMASAYKRDLIAKKKLTEMSRQFALHRALQNPSPCFHQTQTTNCDTNQHVFPESGLACPTNSDIDV